MLLNGFILGCSAWIASMQELQFPGLISAFNAVKLLLIYNPPSFSLGYGASTDDSLRGSVSRNEAQL